MEANLAKFVWLSNATGWGGEDGYKNYLQRNEWTLKQGRSHDELCGLNYDPNELRKNGDFGQFLVP
jgi:hypothetical protein